MLMDARAIRVMRITDVAGGGGEAMQIRASAKTSSQRLNVSKKVFFVNTLFISNLRNKAMYNNFFA